MYMERLWRRKRKLEKIVEGDGRRRTEMRVFEVERSHE
jgi:hypothetical protein